MKYVYFLFVLVFFSCGEDKHTKDVEENTYYSKYMEIYAAYDSIGPAKTIEDLDIYLEEFPNAQNAYIFKAWVLANNNQVNQIDEVFEKALEYDNTNVTIYEYWSALLLKDSSKIETAKRVNDAGFKIQAENIVLSNTQTWIYLYENKFNDAVENAVKVITNDTLNNYRYSRTAAVCAIAIENDSLYHFYNTQAIEYGQTDSTDLDAFYNKKESLFELYNKLK